MKKRRKKTRRAKLETKLDGLWKSVGKSGSSCEICSTLPKKDRVHYTRLHPHHIIGRKAKGTKWDLRNRLWVCPSHHTMGVPNKCVEQNLGGWFWGRDDDWLGTHRPKDKKYLEIKKAVTYTKWTIQELEDMVVSFERLQ